MLTIRRTLAGCFLAFLFCASAFAQTDQPIDAPPAGKQLPQASIIITATASSQRVRCVALGEVNQTRLQVFSSDGSPLFDSQFRLGNLVDWQLVNQQGQQLHDGSYLFLVTVKDFSSHLTQKYGTAVFEQEQISLGQSSPDELPPSLSSALEANKLSATLSPVDRVGVAATTRAANIPTDGSPTDTVTEVGETNPKQATSGGENIAGTGSQNMIAKWIDNSGTLGNSIISEVNGQVGIGTTNPQGQLHIFGTNSQDIFAGMGPDLINGPAFNFGYAGASFGRGAGFFNVRPDASATSPNPSLRFLTANVQRMIITNTGNVGIGTTGPNTKLTVWTPSVSGLQEGIRINNPVGFSGSDNGAALVFSQDRVLGENFVNATIVGAQETANSSANGYLAFSTKSGGNALTEKMRITGDGNVGIGDAAPANRLSVFGNADIHGTLNAFGNVKLGNSAQLFAPGGEENLRIVRGVVSATGNIIVGSGFTVTHGAPDSGQYTVTFNTPFFGPPAVTATADGGASASTAGVTSSSANFQIYALTDGTFAADRAFHFIAIGPR